MENGIFIISLDFELAWGFHDGQKALGTYKNNILGARIVIPKLLELFNKYDIHVTWATVGALGCKSKNELITLTNQDLTYVKSKHNLAKYIEKNVGEDEETDPLHYADSLIDLIMSYSNQYIGSHTFSHFFLCDKTSYENDFDKDIAAVKTVFHDAYTNVFARNQITSEGIVTLAKHGFKAYRGVPENNSGWKLYRERAKNLLLTRALRLIDSYLPLTGYYDYSLTDIKVDSLFNIRGSSFLRPYRPLLRNAENLKINRIRKSMERAATNCRVFHLYWHPHNIGINQKENLEQIEEILLYYRELHNKYGFISMSMEEVCTELWETL